MSAEEFGRYMRADLERWTKLARDRGIELDS